MKSLRSNPQLTAVLVCAAICGCIRMLPAAAQAPKAGGGTLQSPSATVAHGTVEAGEQAKVPAPSKPGQEGLTVHGHWIIDVHNADGTLAEHRDFQNALTGSSMYSFLLGRAVPAGLVIKLSGTASQSTVDYFSVPGSPGNAQFPYLCTLGPTCDPNLTVTLTPAYGGFHGSVTLQGKIAPAADIDMYRVATLMVFCAPSRPSTTSPQTCATSSDTTYNGIDNFTGTNITPLHVLAGQYLIVSVALSFS